MPGLNLHYTIDGRKRRRRTPYRAVNVREADWYNLHLLSNACRSTMVDTFAKLVQEGLAAMREGRRITEMPERLSERLP